MKSTLIACGLLYALLAPAFAQGPGSAQCQYDLSRAGQLVENVAARDRRGPVGDMSRVCAMLRQNRAEMAEAAKLMNRCLTGHARSENVGQIVASLGDVDMVIARRCR